MRLLIQRVTKASVTVKGTITGAIGPGLLVFVAFRRDDPESSVAAAVSKIAGLRIFEDQTGKLNRSISDTGGEVLVVSQFTLYGDNSKGNRPSFVEAAAPDKAETFYNNFIEQLRSAGLTVATGKFRSHMQVELINDGPTTILLDI